MFLATAGRTSLARRQFGLAAPLRIRCGSSKTYFPFDLTEEKQPFHTFKNRISQPNSVTRQFRNLATTDQSPPKERGNSGFSKRQIAELEDHVYKAVSNSIVDPVTKLSLHNLGWLHRRLAISSDGTFQVLLKLPSMLHPKLEELKDALGEAIQSEIQTWLLKAVPKITMSDAKVNIEVMTSKPASMMLNIVEDKDELLEMLGPGLESVSHCLAVYSCKGGVGKSTVAVNLAYELAHRGGRVGLLDLDIYGPSLPVLVQPEDLAVRPSPKQRGMVYPIVHQGVKLLSLGFVARQSGVPGSGTDSGAAVMRGPFAGKVVTQLLKSTDWEHLDILVLDLPPGTGDVQLAVLQEIQVSGAVAVTTPSKLAAVDTKKGIEMFHSLGVPTLTVVENMAFFEADGKRYFPFGKSGDELGGITKTKLPISELTNSSNDGGQPVCLTRNADLKAELDAFGKIADEVSGELLRLQYDTQRLNDPLGTVEFGSDANSFELATTSLELTRDGSFLVRLHSDENAIQKRISPALLRQCDPKTGSPIGKASTEEISAVIADGPVQVVKTKGKQSPAEQATRVMKQGRYGFKVEWADGATIIYSLASVATAVGGTVVK